MFFLSVQFYSTTTIASSSFPFCFYNNNLCHSAYNIWLQLLFVQILEYLCLTVLLLFLSRICYSVHYYIFHFHLTILLLLMFPFLFHLTIATSLTFCSCNRYQILIRWLFLIQDFWLVNEDGRKERHSYTLYLSTCCLKFH